MEQKNSDETSGISSKDYLIALGIVLECLTIYLFLVNKVSIIGVLLPLIVAGVAVTITGLALRDFFRQHK